MNTSYLSLFYSIFVLIFIPFFTCIHPIKNSKYKNKTYEYVYNIDKLYCYHLAFWIDIKSKNTNIIDFINYIKLKVN